MGAIRILASRRLELSLLILAAVTAAAGMALAALGQGQQWSHALRILAVVGMITATALILELSGPRRDRILLPVTALLVSLGVILISRLDGYLATKQILWVLIGCAGLIGAYFLVDPVYRLSDWKYLAGVGALLLMVVTIIFAPEKNGARLWLSFAGRFSFQPSELAKLLMVIFLAGYVAEKGHLLLLRATKRLVEAGLNPRILLIGDGELRSEIEAYVDSHRLHDNVTIMGWQSSEVVSAQLKASRALVMASFAEGLPVVCMESLALGRPVLATRIAGIPELIEPEVNGWLVTPACEESLVTALRELLSTPVDRLREMGAAGREKVLRLHNAKHEASMLLSLFGTGG